MRRLITLLAASMLTLMAGCASMQPADEAQQLGATLGYFERLASASHEEQGSALIDAEAAFERSPNDATRLDLALALLLQPAPRRDDARVELLLAGIGPAPAGQTSARHDLAQHLRRRVGERLRAQEDGQRKADQLLQQSGKERQRSDELLQQLSKERRRAEELQQKLKSLEAIDRDMRTRRKAPK